MSFLGKVTFCASGHALYQLCHVIESDMLNVYHFPTHLFLSYLSFSPCSASVLDAFSFVTDASSHRISSSLCDYSYQCYTTPLMPFIFRVLWFPSLVMTLGLFLCARCILPSQKSRLWHSGCIK